MTQPPPAHVLDIAANRTSTKYGRGELLLRALWCVGQVVFSLIPRPFFAVRASLLRLFGGRIGRDVHVYPSATVYLPWQLTMGDQSSIGEHAYIYNLGPVSIGCRATVSHRAHLCAGTHDYADPSLPLIRSSIHIDDDAWVCADAFVGPDVSVGRGAVVGARAVVTSDVEPWTVVAGNPARCIKARVLRTTTSS